MLIHLTLPRPVIAGFNHVEPAGLGHPVHVVFKSESATGNVTFIDRCLFTRYKRIGAQLNLPESVVEHAGFKRMQLQLQQCVIGTGDIDRSVPPRRTGLSAGLLNIVGKYKDISHIVRPCAERRQRCAQINRILFKP
ncbi:hypothetical protein D3C78_1393070 [compost metagenome]